MSGAAIARLGPALRPLPEGWRWVRLGELCRLTNGDAFKPTDWSTTGTPIVRIQNLNDPSRPFNYWDGPLVGRVVVSEGDVLLAWSGTPGTSFGAHLWERDTAVLNQHIFRVDFLDQRAVKEWVIWAVNFRLHVLIAKAHGGVGLRHVTKREVESLDLPLPPVAEQRRIVARLREHMAAIGQARAAAEKQLQAAKTLPAAYLREVFLNPQVQGWPKRRIGEVATLLPARSVASDGDTEVQVVTTACLTEAGFDPSGVKTARMWARYVMECRAAPGEILLARSNTPELVGRASLYSGQPPGVVASDLTVRLATRPECHAPFLSACLSLLYLSGHWRRRAGGASGSMKKITRRQIAGEEVPLPDLSVQQRTAAELQASGDCARKIQQAAIGQLAEIERLPASVLRRAFSGEL